MRTKIIPVGTRTITVTVKDASANGNTALHCEATVDGVTYAERMTLPYDNLDYTQEQAQRDFDAHCEKVAKLAAARALSASLAAGLK